MAEEQDEYVKQLSAELGEARGKVTELSTALSGSNVSREGNFLQYQIESRELLDMLENFYRGKYLSVDKEGNQIWKESTDKDAKTFNEIGVAMMMEVVTKYIDKNTMLSSYQEKRIMRIIGDLGNEIILLILCNQKKMGMDTYVKKTRFRMIVVSTLHMIESAYRRAINGDTVTKVNESRIVTQADHINMPFGGKPQKSAPSLRNLYGMLN